MKRTELLIQDSRESTESTEFSTDTGIQDSEFLRYLDNAQDRIYSRILSVHPEMFMDEKEVSTTPGQEAYDLPDLTYLGTKIELVEYSQNGQAKDYYPLNKGRLRERFNGNPGYPCFYIRRNGKVLVQPAPQNSNGKLRFNSFKKLPNLDKRRGVVESVVLTGSSITSLFLDPTTLIDEDVTDIQDLGYITVVNKDGIVQMRRIPISSINTTTGEVDIDGVFSFDSGETIAVGNFIVMGKYATSHSYLDDSCERYLLAHCDWKILKRDSSNDSIEQNQELTDMLNEIVDAYKDADEDVDYVPVLDTDYLDSSGGY